MRLPKTPRRWRHPGHPRWWIPVLLVPLALGLGCGAESFKPEPKANDPDLFRQLELNHHAVTLAMIAPYNTLQLTATPRNYEGTVLPDLPAPQYVSRDREKVAITTEGLLVAVAPTSQPVWVVATVITDNLKHVDSVLVKVVALDPPPVLASFSVHPLPPDSAKVATTSYDPNTGTVTPGSLKDTLPVRALDPSDVQFSSLIIGGIPVSFRSSDPLIATIHRTTGIITGLRPGTVTIVASTTAFGVAKEDVLSYRIGFPLDASIFIGSPNSGQLPGSFSRPDYWVGTGANVTWRQSGVSVIGWAFVGSLPTFEVDVTFDEADLPNVMAYNPALATSQAPCHPTPIFPLDTLVRDCGSGNIVLGRGSLVFNSPPYAFITAGRSFPVPGTYDYRSTIHGTSGRIVVVDEQE